jgi:hypothetical protein
LFESAIFLDFFGSDQVDSKAIQEILKDDEEDKKKQVSKTAKFFFDEYFISEEVAEVSIPAVQHMADHTLFRILCKNGEAASRSENNEWISLRRLLDFYELDEELRGLFSKSHPAILDNFPPLPTKAAKVIIDHRDPKFIEERRLILENYLKKMIHIRQVVCHNHFLKFLNADI